ncbi:MAG: 3-oxoacyl-[acyl-carrier-protein] reductase [Desulfobacteraceae bacterium]|nr:3-oxoacyl-[acyl-carrier-protein] reductase [Desulfobacteraceae bacterium]
MEFKDKRVIVTGGTKGLGRAIGLTFARKGAWVAINYSSDDEAASKMEAELKNLSTNFLLLKADVSSKSAVETMTGRVLEKWEHVDVLVNNAGILRDKLLMFLDELDWDRVLEVNLKGTYLCSRAIIKTMISRRAGRIINIVSPSALTGRPGQTNYSASKGGIVSFTKSLSKEMAKLGITVNAVCPGLISTPMTENLDQETKESFLSMIPMGKFGSPEDIANAVLFLASEKTGYVTGQVLAVDGGLT